METPGRRRVRPARPAVHRGPRQSRQPRRQRPLLPSGAGPARLRALLQGRRQRRFRPKGEPALWIYASDEPGPAHVAFRAAERKAVDRFHAAGLDAGGKDHGKPGVRADYAPNYYAAFLTDPDGNNVEAVCLT